MINVWSKKMNIKKKPQAKLLVVCIFCLIVFMVIGLFVIADGISAVILELPTNSSWTNGDNNTIEFIFNYNGENATASCELFIGGVGFGVNDSVLNNTNTTLFANDTISDGSYNWSVTCTNGTNTASSSNFTINVDTTPPIITFINQTPSDIMWNSTGISEILFNITDASGINESSTVVFFGINHSHNGDYHFNWSYRFPESSKQPDGRRSPGRNESKWWESVIYKESTDDIWSFGARGQIGLFVNVIDNSSIHSYFNWTEYDVHLLFPQTWYVDRAEMYKENKSNQFIEIYKNRPVKIAYNLTIHDLSTNFTEYDHFNIEAQGSDFDLIVYKCNSSYTTGNPTINNYCQAGYHITGLESRDIDIVNSSYIEKVNGGVDGYYGSVKLTSQMFLVLYTSEPTSAKAYKFYYANNTLADNTNFNETNVMWTSGNNGVAYTQYAATPDFWYSPAIENYDKLIYYVYSCDDVGNCANSTWQIDTFQAESNQAPGTPTLTNPLENYNVSVPFYINWTTSGDLDGDDYNASVYLYNPDGTLNITLADNNITDDKNYFYINSSIADGKYRINITLCDALDCSSKLTGWNFTINAVPIVTKLAPASSIVTTSIIQTYIYNVSDTNNITSCSLLMDGAIVQTDTSINKSENNSITHKGTIGIHIWSVQCYDEYSYIGTSGNFSIQFYVGYNGGVGGGTICTPVWDCSSWSFCVDGLQTRECESINSCTRNKPDEDRTCSVLGSIVDGLGSITVDPIIQRLNCGSKPEVGEWSGCSSLGITSRINYECSKETEFKWLSYVEAKDCRDINGFWNDVGGFFTKSIPNFLKKVWDVIIFWN